MKTCYSKGYGTSLVGIKHSDDGGKTWSPMRALLPEGIDGSSTLGNFAAFVVPKTAAINLVFCVNNTYVYNTVSSDTGESWGSAINITASVKENDEGWVATGPSNAVVLSTGRILVPLNTNVARGSITIDYELVSGSVGRNRQCPMSHLLVGVRGGNPSPLPPLHRGSGNVDPSVNPGKPEPPIDPCYALSLSSLFKLQQRAFALISDDEGHTWRRSQELPLLASETAFADLGNGRVLARSRLAEGGWQDGCHHFAMSSDGGETWENSRLANHVCIEDPGVQTALLGR